MRLDLLRNPKAQPEKQTGNDRVDYERCNVLAASPSADRFFDLTKNGTSLLLLYGRELF